MHFDIAAPVESVGIRLLYFGWRNGVLLALLLFIGFSLQGERATGYGVALLLALFGKSSESELLKSIAPK